jgi:hypothetical protein
VKKKHENLPLMHDICVGNFTTTPRIVFDSTKPLTPPVTSSQLMADLMPIAQFPAGKSFFSFVSYLNQLRELPHLSGFHPLPGGKVPETDLTTYS